MSLARHDRVRRAVRPACLRSALAWLGVGFAAAIAGPAFPAHAAAGEPSAQNTASAGLRGPTTTLFAAPADEGEDAGAIAAADTPLRGSQSPEDTGIGTSPPAPDQMDAIETTGSIKRIPAVSGTAFPDNRADLGRINLRAERIGGRGMWRPAPPLDQAPGIRIGSFILRPELTQSIGNEDRKIGDFHENRTYTQTEIRSTLTSDWTRHALTITGSGVLQKNISGSGETRPSADVNADLRLDLADQTTADLTAGYDFRRESNTDPNAIVGAETQATVNTFTGGVAVSRAAGLLRGSLSARAIRTTYGDVKLADGSTVSEADRNTLAGEFAARIGYALSPALIPFLEAKYRRTNYDNTFDSAGYRRSSDTYTVEAGIAADFGEKLSGEFAAGYTLRRFEDPRLADLGGLAVDATGHWSPHRGTDISLGLATALEDSTTPGESGPITYAVNTTLTQQVLNDVVARLGAGYLYRDYRDGSALTDQQVYSATAGLSWYLSPYLSLDGNLSFERTREKGAADEDIATVDMGLTVRR